MGEQGGRGKGTDGRREREREQEAMRVERDQDEGRTIVGPGHRGKTVVEREEERTNGRATKWPNWKVAYDHTGLPLQKEHIRHIKSLLPLTLL